MSKQSKPKEAYNLSAGQSNALVQLFCDKKQKYPSVPSKSIGYNFCDLFPSSPFTKVVMIN